MKKYILRVQRSFLHRILSLLEYFGKSSKWDILTKFNLQTRFCYPRP